MISTARKIKRALSFTKSKQKRNKILPNPSIPKHSSLKKKPPHKSRPPSHAEQSSNVYPPQHSFSYSKKLFFPNGQEFNIRPHFQFI